MESKQQHPNSLANLRHGNRKREPVKDLANKIREFDIKKNKPIFELIFEVLHDKKEATKDRLHAAELLMNHGWGKAVETVIIEEVNSTEVALKQYSLEELHALRNAMVVEGTVVANEEEIIDGNETGY